MKLQRLSDSDNELINFVLGQEKQLFGEGAFSMWALKPLAALQHIWVCFQNEQPVAYAILFQNKQDDQNIFLFSFGVALEYQKQGIGKGFLKILLTEMRSLGYQRLQLTVSPDNHIARHLYYQSGRLLSEELKVSYYGVQENRLFLTLDISDPHYQVSSGK